MSEIKLERARVSTPERPSPRAWDMSRPFRCVPCKDTGAIIAYKQGAPYAFNCDCDIARQKGRKYPAWSAYREGDFSLAGGLVL